MAETEEKKAKSGNGSSASVRADLHLHTHHSDGVHSPYEIVRRARNAGLSAISITDHDNVAAIDEAVAWGRQMGVEVVTGVELSVALGEKDVHLLAYFFDHTNRELLDYLTFFRHERLKRAERIVEKLNKINVPLRMEAVLDQAGIGSVGRPHIASALVEKGLIDTYHEAFLKYIGTGAPAYEKKYQLNPEEAVRLITAAGGLTFLAHPGKYTSEAELLRLIHAGVDGIEVVHPSHSEAQQAHYRRVIDQYFLLESGGSDYHGGKKSDDDAIGTFTVPIFVVDQMRRRLFL
jgi:hypothetical protein